MTCVADVDAAAVDSLVGLRSGHVQESVKESKTDWSPLGVRLGTDGPGAEQATEHEERGVQMHEWVSS